MYDSPDRMAMAREEHISLAFDGFHPHVGMSSQQSYNTCRSMLTPSTLDSNRYFSFPSFENWEPTPLEEGETEMKSP